MIWSQRKYSLYQNFWYEAIILTDYLLFIFFFTFEKYYDSDSMLFIVLEKIQDDFYNWYFLNVELNISIN